MKTVDQKETEILGKINDTLSQLDTTMGKMEDTDSRIKGFFEQEKAIHEIKKAVRQSERYDKVNGTWDYDREADIADDEKGMGKAFIKIDRRLADLDKTLDSLDNDDISRYDAQNRALSDVKKILRQEDDFDMYSDDANALDY